MQQAITPQQNPDEIEISVTDIARNLYSGRWLIVLGALACVLLALAVAFATAKYKSTTSWYFDGLVRLSAEGGGISVAEYDRIMDSAKTADRFEAYVQSLKLPALKEVELLRELFTSREGIAEQIKPFRSSLVIADAEKKEDEKKGAIQGVALEVSAKSRELSHAALVLLSSYLTDTLLYDFYYESLLGRHNIYFTQNAKTENALIDLKIKRPQLLQKQEILENLIAKYARLFESSRQAEMLITTEDTLGSSPIVKLMNLQLEIAALEASEKALQRQQQQNALYLDFYQRAVELHRNAQYSQHFFSALADILPAVFQGKDLAQEEIKEVYNDLFVANEAAQDLYRRSSRQMVSPNTPAVPTARFGLIGAAALFAGLLLSAVLVLLRNWWQQVKTAA